MNLFGGDYWQVIYDGEPRARRLYERHYSARRNRHGARKVVGPGEYLLLLGRDERALFVWRRFIDRSGQQGVNCAVFRNEGPRLSSELIREAQELAWEKWPGVRLYTYVHPRRVRSSNPGCCFRKAGWRRCGETKGGLVILETVGGQGQ